MSSRLPASVALSGYVGAPLGSSSWEQSPEPGYLEFFLVQGSYKSAQVHRKGFSYRFSSKKTFPFCRRAVPVLENSGSCNYFCLLAVAIYCSRAMVMDGAFGVGAWISTRNPLSSAALAVVAPKVAMRVSFCLKSGKF